MLDFVQLTVVIMYDNTNVTTNTCSQLLYTLQTTKCCNCLGVSTSEDKISKKTFK